jgi:hypothetical protein
VTVTVDEYVEVKVEVVRDSKVLVEVVPAEVTTVSAGQMVV